MSGARDGCWHSCATVACLVYGTVLFEQLPLTVGPVPQAPLSEVRMTLDLTTVREPDEVSVLLQLLMRERALLTWIIAERTLQHGLRYQGYLTRVVFPAVIEGRTTMTVDLHLPARCTTCCQTPSPPNA
jgi:hypothetical protein